MKTAMDVLERAMQLCGMTAPNGTIDRVRDADIIKKGLALVGQIYTDLHYIEHPNDEPVVLTLATEIPLASRTVNDVMPYGVAMLLSSVEGYTTVQSVFANLYNQKRQAARHRTDAVTDTMPSAI